MYKALVILALAFGANARSYNPTISVRAARARAPAARGRGARARAPPPAFPGTRFTPGEIRARPARAARARPALHVYLSRCSASTFEVAATR